VFSFNSAKNLVGINTLFNPIRRLFFLLLVKYLVHCLFMRVILLH
jgi:hypothetical protein